MHDVCWNCHRRRQLTLIVLLRVEHFLLLLNSNDIIQKKVDLTYQEAMAIFSVKLAQKCIFISLLHYDTVLCYFGSVLFV